MTNSITKECQDGISFHWRVSRWHIPSLKSVKMAYLFTEECQDGIYIHWRVSRWHIPSLKSVKMAYLFTEEYQDGILQHWRVSRWYTSSPVSIMLLYSVNEVCHDVTKHITCYRQILLRSKFGDNSNWKRTKASGTCRERREDTKFLRWVQVGPLRRQCSSTHEER
jgi:hypothetical protein